MQWQYRFKRQLITEEDLIRYSDFPQKDLLLQRLAKEASEDTAENLVADLTYFASIFSKLLSQGLTEEQAAQQAIDILIEEKNAMMQDLVSVEDLCNIVAQNSKACYNCVVRRIFIWQSLKLI